MVKGFVFFKDGKIPFVIEDYRMELFTDDGLLSDFCQTYNFKENYTLEGQYFRSGTQAQHASFLVEHSVGSTCYLRCYILNTVTADSGYDTLGLQSPFLDDVFRYKYKYLELIRSGVNLAVEPVNGYAIPFSMNDNVYEATFRIGHDNCLGLLEDFDRKGEILVPIQSNTLQECYNVTIVWHRLAMFMTSHADVPFKRITLYKDGWKKGWFYCPLVSEKSVSGYDGLFHEFDVMKYVPKILDNIALDSGNKITRSIPLGHLGNYDSLFSPQRFVEQVMAFEYLFDKLEHAKAQDKRFTLKNELEYMLNQFPKLLGNSHTASSDISNQIKEIRRNMTHGHAYYYDFKNELSTQRRMLLLDRLIRNMSLMWIGFTKDEIDEYPVY